MVEISQAEKIAETDNARPVQNSARDVETAVNWNVDGKSASRKTADKMAIVAERCMSESEFCFADLEIQNIAGKVNIRSFFAQCAKTQRFLFETRTCKIEV